MSTIDRKFIAFMREGKYSEAEAILESVPADRLASTELFALADCKYELCHHNEAIDLYTKFIHENSGSKFVKNAYFNRGLCRREIDNFAEALEDFELASRECGKAPSLIGEMLYLLQRYPETIFELEEWCQRDEADSEDFYRLGAAYNQLDRHEEALSKFQQGHRRFPDATRLIKGVYTELGCLGRDQERAAFFHLHRAVIDG
jgi:tetratricopeptide (TPR) repeat protein